MKKLNLILLFIGLPLLGQNPVETQPETSDISSKSLEKTVSFLAADSLMGRDTGSPGIEQAAQFIEQSFKDSGLKPLFKSYRDSFAFEDQVGYNLAAYKEGNDPDVKDEIVVLGAHYDHIGIIEPVEGDSIANGANDDASGTAAVLELARYFADKETKRSMLFILFSAEEKGLVGSTHIANRLKEEGLHPYVMLNYEMIGVPQEGKDYSAYLTGFEKSNFAKQFNEYAKKEVLGFLPQAKEYQLFKRSDNYAFYKTFHSPAHTISSFDFTNFDHYHQVGDEVELMDFEFMERLVKETVPGIEGIVNEKESQIKLNEE